MPVLTDAVGRAVPRLAALILAAATAAAGCGVATPRAAGTGSAAGDGAPTARAATPPVFAATPPVFAATLVPTRRGAAWPVGLFSSATGQRVRRLTRPPGGASDLVLYARAGWVYFAAWPAGGPPGVWRVPVTGGRARLVRAGTADYALSPDGRRVAWVATVPRGPTAETTEIVVTNRVTGHRRTIVMAAHQPVAGSQVGVTNLAWAPDDTHLAVEVRYAAFASDVIVFNTRTARAIAAGRRAPCPGACAAEFPAYQRTGTLTYLTSQLADAGPNAITLVSWAGGHRATRLATLWAGLAAPPIVQGESITPEGAAIWVLETPARYTIARWAGGKPVQVGTLPRLGHYGLAGIAW